MTDQRPFYDLAEAERIALTLDVIRGKGTLQSRWVALAGGEAGGWDARAAKAAYWLADVSVVLDLGCGTMNLRKHLSGDQGYLGCDVVQRDAQTIVCDLNHEPPPVTSATGVACLGLLEYLHRPSEVMAALARSYDAAVVSYCVVDAPAPLPEPRRAHAWVNDFDAHTLEAMFEQTGWMIRQRDWVDGVQRLWRLTAKRSQPTTS